VNFKAGVNNVNAMTWQKTLEDYLVSTLPYCLDDDRRIVRSELFGENDSMGLIDHLIDLITLELKHAYMAGFLTGVKEVVKEDPSVVVDEIANQVTAERKYMEWRSR
jgi:hypothetical protein